MLSFSSFALDLEQKIAVIAAGSSGLVAAYELEGLQGELGTYYTGAIMNFEPTETVSRYSKKLIKKEFVPKHSF